MKIDQPTPSHRSTGVSPVLENGRLACSKNPHKFRLEARTPAQARCLCSALLFSTLTATTSMAATTMVSYSYNPNILIPDNSSVGIADFQTVTTNIVDITSVTVVLGINGGFNGDFYVYLLHNSGFSVLLNRVGKTATNEFGYADSGINATFTAAAVNDVHNYRTVNNPLGAPLTGTWQPDARQSDPTVTLDTDARTATLASFSGLDANGTWVLYVADRSSGSIGTLANWSLTIEGNAIPEPSSALMLLGVSALCLRRRR